MSIFMDISTGKMGDADGFRPNPAKSGFCDISACPKVVIDGRFWVERRVQNPF
jgi:hypothetical protein